MNVGKSIPINEAVAGDNFIPFHPNCDCMAEVLDKDGNFIENIGSINDLYNDENDIAEDLFDSFADIVDQVVLGDFSEKNTVSGNVWSLIIGVLSAIVGIDAPFDIRDFIYDVSHFDYTKEDLFKISLDIVSLAPVIGAISKYGGKIVDGAKYAIKYSDDIKDSVKSSDKISDIVDSAEDVIKHSDNIADVGKSIPKRERLLKEVKNEKLKNAINELYRKGSSIGDGGTADAIRYELKTNKLVGGKSHIKKGKERLKNLNNILKREKLNERDKEIILFLINDLENALEGK